MADIRYQNINFNHGKTKILRNVSFTVEPGICCALIGHNGAGKTTLIKLLLGMIKPDAGSIELCQYPPTGKHEKQVKSQIGFVPESIHFQANETGLELMQYVAKLKSASLQDIMDKMALTNIAFAADRKISAYSKGMKQRLGLAQAMLGDPKVLILDEPASGLDPDSRQILYSSLKKHAESGNTVMFSSHALNDIEAYVDHIILLNEGCILMDCNIEDYRKSLKLPVLIEIETEGAGEAFYAHLSQLGELIQRDNIAHLKVKHSDKLPALAFITASECVRDIRLLDAGLEKIYHELLRNRAAL